MFDLGGGTFDVSVIEMSKSEFNVKSVCGDPHLGGEDFDNALLDWCVEQFKAKTEIDLKKIPKALRRLKTQVEKSKRLLS